jgi:hypothetical protein
VRSAKQVLYSRSVCVMEPKILQGLKMVTHAQGGVAGEGGR